MINGMFFLLLNIANKKFQNGNYESILLGFKQLYSNQDPYSCYVNVHRVASLMMVGDETWRRELDYILDNKQLDLLGFQDKKYILVFLESISDLDLSLDVVREDLAFSKVSKRTKKYFRLN